VRIGGVQCVVGIVPRPSEHGTVGRRTVTIQDLGSIGELIAAVATLATLAYLAVQIRANTRAVRSESRRSEIQALAAIAQPLIADADVARLFNAGLADLASLGPEDQTRFYLLLGSFVGADAAVFDEVRLGVASSEALGPRAANLRAFLGSPGGRAYWQQFRGRYPQSFQDFVDRDVLQRLS
jgi:hypothetical protein